MKYKRKLARLKARIKHYETTYTSEQDVRSHKKPGSQKR
jgi:hypothetical protein